MLITETEGPGNLQNVCCFIAQNRKNEAEIQKVNEDFYKDVATAGTPVVSDFRDIYEVWYGVDYVSGEPLTGTQYTVTVIGMLIPFAGGRLLRAPYTEFGEATLDAVGQTSKHADEAVDLAKKVADAPKKMDISSLPKNKQGGIIGTYKKMFKQQQMTEDELLEMFTPESVQLITGKKLTHDAHKIIESMSKSTENLDKAAEDLAKGLITQKEYDEILDQFEGIYTHKGLFHKNVRDSIKNNDDLYPPTPPSQ
ncbi:hypothetical protein [Gimesia panareensis]|uniref:hypothetical protein n=1 Tax=Gimesia panareensis TaxID=2527978 RepID=UPI00118914AB|nr:hypothetical protein [Gimesia panareensis]QDU50504.1 hypothetical protein Pan110_28550 [Gimesia panareensis]